MKKDGFISTSFIYTFFVLFLLLMLFLLNSYSKVRFLQGQYKEEIKMSLYKLTSADINLYLKKYNEDKDIYEQVTEIPFTGYKLEKYNCDHNDTIVNYFDGYIELYALHKETCYAYFKEFKDDFELKIFTEEIEDGPKTEVTSIPNSDYIFNSSHCSNDAVVTFDEVNRKLNIKTLKKAICNVIFTRSGGTIENG